MNFRESRIYSILRITIDLIVKGGFTITKVLGFRLLAILFYVVPIAVFTIITKTVSVFVLSAGAINVLLDLAWNYLPLGLAYNNAKNSNAVFLSLAGICLILFANMQINLIKSLVVLK